MWQVNDDGLSSLLDVAELLGVRGLKSDRVRGMDPRIRIHTKMSWIRNTGSNN